MAKSQASFLMVVGALRHDGRYTDIDIADYLTSKLADPSPRVNGVGDVQVFGGQYAMRIWLDPYKLNNYKLMPSDVRAAVLAQNVQVSAGQVGGAADGRRPAAERHRHRASRACRPPSSSRRSS